MGKSDHLHRVRPSRPSIAATKQAGHRSARPAAQTKQLRMSPQQEATLARLTARIGAFLNKKFREGDEEHGGSSIEALTVDDLIHAALEETVDQCVYLFLLWEKTR